MKVIAALHRTSESIFLMHIAHIRSLSFLFPDYKVVTGPPYPEQVETVLIFNSNPDPRVIKGDLTWITEAPSVQVFEGNGKRWEKFLGRPVEEVAL
jgi:hypothetical protein